MLVKEEIPDTREKNTNGTISANTSNVPLQVNGTVDTTSPNGKLPEGNVSMDQIMGLMNSK